MQMTDATDTTVKVGARPETRRLGDEAAEALSSPHKRIAHRKAHVDLDRLQQQYDAAGIPVHVVKPDESWRSIARASLRHQHRAADAKDPAMVRQEITRIMWETQQWKNSSIKDPSQRDETFHRLKMHHPMLLYMGDANAPAALPYDGDVGAPGQPRKITAQNLHSLVGRDLANLSKAPIVSRMMGADYGSDGLYVVKGTEKWEDIAKMSLRWRNKAKAAHDPDAVDHEIARIMYATEKWRTGDIADPNQRKVTPEAFPLEKDMILCLWDKTISPDDKHVNAFWRSPVRATPGATTILGYRDQAYVGERATAIFMPGSAGAIEPGGKAYVMKGAEVTVLPRRNSHDVITILNHGGKVNIPPGSGRVYLKDI